MKSPYQHKINASGKTLGRLATKIAVLLQGKQKPGFKPHLDEGDFVIVFNTDKIRVTGNKAKQKIYWRHSGYPGGIRSVTYEELFKRDSREVLRRAVYGMLPRNKLRARRMRRLKLYRGSYEKTD